MRIHRKIVPLLLIPILGGSRCAVLGGTEEPRSLREARERWEAAGAADYTFDVRRVCFCVAAEPVRIVVRGGEAVSWTVVATGNPLPEEQRPWYPTIQGLFDFLEDAVERDAHRIDARYDPQRGYPIDVFVDYEDRVADEEMGYAISAFTPE